MNQKFDESLISMYWNFDESVILMNQKFDESPISMNWNFDES